MANAPLGPLELTVLLAVARLGNDSYGLAIRRDLAARTGRDHSVGAIYTGGGLTTPAPKRPPTVVIGSSSLKLNC